MLLDEPTSSVEPDSEATIIAALDRLMAGRTTVLTSHRPSLISQADLAYVIENGRVTEHGAPGQSWAEHWRSSPRGVIGAFVAQSSGAGKRPANT